MRSLLAELIEERVKAGAVIGATGTLGSDRLMAHMAQWQARGVLPRQAVGFSRQNGDECLLDLLALICLNVVVVPLAPQMPEMQRTALWQALGVVGTYDENGYRPSAESVTLWPADVTCVVHSSGSTGLPKAVPYTAGNILRNANLVADRLGRNWMRHAGAFSLCTSSGLYNSVLIPLVSGGVVLSVPHATGLHIDAFIRQVIEKRPDYVWVSPTILQMLIKRAPKDSFKGLRALISCTAPLSQSGATQAWQHLGCPVIQSYGLSETLILTLEDTRRNPETEFSSGAVFGGAQNIMFKGGGEVIAGNGCIMPGYAQLEQGELTFTGPNGFSASEFYPTGDMGWMDLQGRLHVQGRLVNVIEIAGHKISPERVESALLSLAGISEAAVVPRLDTSGRTQIVACVVSDHERVPNQWADACAQILGPMFRPAHIEIVSELPRLAGGKLDRELVKQHLSTLEIHA